MLSISRTRVRRIQWAVMLVIGSLLTVIAVSGCQSTAVPTLPPATAIVDQPQPAPATATPQPTDMPPPATLTPTAVPPTPTLEPVQQPVKLTILHINDVLGEVDPCG